MMDQMDQMDQGEDNSVTPPEDKKKRSPLGQMWSATLNNWKESEMDQLDHVFTTSGWPAAIGQEVGASGTPHLQMWVDFGKRVRPTEMKCFRELKRIHWGDSKGKPQTSTDTRSGPTYCAKDGNFKMYNGAKPKREIKWPDFDKPWQQEILELVGQTPDDRTIYWYYSTEYGIGKTTFAKYLVKKHEACLLDGKKADIKNAVLTWVKDKGEYPDLCLWNIPASLEAEYISYTALEQIKDALFYSGKYEGGSVAEVCPHVIVFANVAPQGHDMDPRRFVIKCIDEADAYAPSYEDKPAWGL